MNSDFEKQFITGVSLCPFARIRGRGREASSDAETGRPGRVGAPGNSGSRGLILQESVWPLTTLSPLGGLAPARGRLRRGAAAGGAAAGGAAEGVQPCRPRFWVVTCCQPFGILSLANWSSQRLENGHYCNVRAGPGTTARGRACVTRPAVAYPTRRPRPRTHHLRHAGTPLCRSGTARVSRGVGTATRAATRQRPGPPPPASDLR